MRQTRLYLVASLGMLLHAVLWPQQKPASIVSITVDATQQRHAISPLIYGVNYGTTKQLQELRAPVNRSGGDSAEVYDYQSDARNSGNDWFYESYPANRSDVMQQYGDGFVALTERVGADSMLTVPMMGWVAKLGPNRSRLASFSITKYGLQKATDIHGFAEAGNGIRMDGSFIHNDPNDAMQPDSPSRESAWIASLAAHARAAHAKNVRYYLLGNEPARWYEIHREVHPEGTHASELLAKSLALANAIHHADPAAKVVAPEEWDPVGTLDSGYDEQLRELKSAATPDRLRETGGMDFLPWLLSQWKSAGHPVDIVSVHYYPQGGEYSQDVSERMQLLRNRSTRGLWDPAYHDIAWVPQNTALLPSLRQMVDRYYIPGTSTAVTEYSWGAENHMNGATAQADVLGIFGREGLALATRWIAPPEGSPVFLAMRMYRNYDNRGGSFGDVSVAAHAPDPDTVSAFAAERTSDHAMTIMLINKQLHAAAPSVIALRGFALSGTVETIVLSEGRVSSMPTASYQNGEFSTTLAPQSVTLFVVHGHGR